MTCLPLKSSVLMWSVLAIAACANAPQALPTLFPPPEPTREPTRAAFVLATATESSTVILPIEPTRAASAPATAAISPTPTLAGHSTATSGAAVTPKPTYLVETNVAASPNGQWTALIELLLPAGVPTDQFHRQLRVLRADHLQEWIAIDEWSNYGLGYPVPVVVHWSGDGAAMFFADQAVPDGCGAAHTWNYRRLDLATGEVRTVLAAGGQAHAFAPTTSALAVGSTESGQSVLRVTNGTLASPQPLALLLPMTYRLDQIAWSDDEESLALVAVAGEGGCGDGTLAPRTYLRVDLVDVAQTVLLADDERGLSLLGWSGADRLLLGDPAGQRWDMDAVTGALAPRP